MEAIAIVLCSGATFAVAELSDRNPFCKVAKRTRGKLSIYKKWWVPSAVWRQLEAVHNDADHGHGGLGHADDHGDGGLGNDVGWP